MRIIALIVVAVFAVIFAIQNTDVATISLLWWQVRASLAVIMVLCLSVGLLVGLAVLAPLLYRRREVVDSSIDVQPRTAQCHGRQGDQDAHRRFSGEGPRRQRTS